MKTNTPVDLRKVAVILENRGITMSIDEIFNRYSEPHRHYHTFKHILKLIKQINDLRIKLDDKEFLIVLALFHDIVYDPIMGDSEARSSELFLESCDPAVHFNRLVSDAILDTKDHVGRTTLSKIFCMLDMSIINGTYDELLEWEKGIYMEYKSFGNKMYKLGRLNFLMKTYIGSDNAENLKRLIQYVNKTY